MQMIAFRAFFYDIEKEFAQFDKKFTVFVAFYALALDTEN